jgi:hypothetical protein
VDASGAAYVVGQTFSTDFPTTPGVFQQYNGGGVCGEPPIPCPDAFVTKVNPGGVGLAYSTYLGGDKPDYGYAIAIDANGAAYVTGYTYSSSFPIVSGAYQPTCASCPNWEDTFITKLNATGSRLLYSTFLGGYISEIGTSIAVDPSGAAYVTGGTFSSDFPITPDAFQVSIGGGTCSGSLCPDAYTTKLNASGSDLIYSTFLGATGWEIGYGIAVDTGGAAYVTGDTGSFDFPVTPGAFQTAYGGGQCLSIPCPDGFVTKLNMDGSDLIYSTFLGGNDWDIGYGIRADASGYAYVTGGAESINFPVTPGAFQTTYRGWGDDFVTKLNPTGSQLVYSTFVGGTGSDASYSMAVDGSGAAYIVGWTTSNDFPITPGAFQTTCSGGCYYGDAIITKLNAAGSGLDYSTFLGGSDIDAGYAIAIDAATMAYVTGYTLSPDFPNSLRASQAAWGGDTCFAGPCSDAFVAAFDIGLHLSNHVSLPLILNRR